MITFIVVALVAVAAFFGYKLYTKSTAAKTVVQGGVSAFAKVAEVEGKLIALKATTAIKAAEAKAVHAGLDEVSKLLG